MDENDFYLIICTSHKTLKQPFTTLTFTFISNLFRARTVHIKMHESCLDCYCSVTKSIIVTQCNGDFLKEV